MVSLGDLPKRFSQVIHSGHSEVDARFCGPEICITVNMSQGTLEGSTFLAVKLFCFFAGQLIDFIAIAGAH